MTHKGQDVPFAGNVTGIAQLADIVILDTQFFKNRVSKIANKYRHVAIKTNIYESREYYTSFHL